MSTKVDIDYNYGEGCTRLGGDPLPSDITVSPFHFYGDIFKSGFVLEIEDSERFPLEFSAHNGVCSLRVPVALWNRLVRLGEQEDRNQYPDGKADSPDPEATP